MRPNDGVLSLVVIAMGSYQVALAAPESIDDGALQLGDCARHLKAVVFEIRENARLQGSKMLVERKADGSVIVHFDLFRQRMRCLEGVLLVDYPDPIP